MRLFYFFLGLSIPIFIASSQIGDKFKTPAQIENEITNIYQMKMDNFRIEDSTPTVDFIKEGGGLFVYSNDACNLVARVKGRRFKFIGVPF